MKKLIVLADWAEDSMTRQEVRTAVEGNLKNPSSSTPNISFVSATPSTIHTAYLLRQLVETEARYGRPSETVIFQNTDPRLAASYKLTDARGADFLVIRLTNGMYLCGPNAGYDFSFIKDMIHEVFTYEGFDRGGQFRSRDLYSRMCAHLMDAMEDELEFEQCRTTIIPEVSGHFIGHIDNYGNIKTTFTLEDIKGVCELGEYVDVIIGESSARAMYAKHLFGACLGELAIYPGSSGHKDNPYMEISAWSHFDSAGVKTGAHHFRDPRPGAQVSLSPIKKK